MHRLAAKTGGWTPDTGGVIIISQNPAPIVFLTAADTDIQTLALATHHLGKDFPAIRAVNILQLQQQYSIDHYADTVLSTAKIIVLRLLGGRSYWSYGLEVVKEVVADTGATLFVLPGDDKPEPTLTGHSTASLNAVDTLWRYLTYGGVDNWVNGFKFLADSYLSLPYPHLPPREVERWGFYPAPEIDSPDIVPIFFYRSHYLAGNTFVIDSLCKALIANNITPLPIFLSSLREVEIQKDLLDYFSSRPPGLILDTTSFSISGQDKKGVNSFWRTLNVPVFQVILSGGDVDTWRDNYSGLSPRDVAINVALPEMDGKIITRAVSFKSPERWHEVLETPIVIYEPRPDRVDFVVGLAKNYLELRKTANRDKKIAIVLANYPNKDGRIANGVGLDTPASCINILRELEKAGYTVPDIPEDGDALMKLLIAGITNDPDSRELKPVYQYLSPTDYGDYFATLPEAVQNAITTRWGEVENNIPIAGITLGNVFIGIQPGRGYDLDPSLNYHSPDLEPPHSYLAFYYWLRSIFRVRAIVHLGKHGNLEWLPGKSIALSPSCYPEIALGTIPNFYPFIVNDPGEGSSAKRRSAAVIIDHLTPPLTRAGLHPDLLQLELLIDEYYGARSLDPGRSKLLEKKILASLQKTHLHKDLGFDDLSGLPIDDFLNAADTYLCELKEAQIRDGLHIFGTCPEGEQLRDLLLSIARSPDSNRLGLTRSIARDLDLDLDPLAEYNDTTTEIEDLALDLIAGKIPPPGPNSDSELLWIQNTLLPRLKRTPDELDNLLLGLAGSYVPSGPSGAPSRGRPDVLPTGRNFYSVDTRSIPTPTAWEIGRKAADALIERYTLENGEYPRTMAISIWGTSTMRTGGDDISQVLALAGVRPRWDDFSGRVIGYEILTPSALGRPRVDVTVRVSGFFRDSFPSILHLLNLAIKEVACQEEDREINPLAARVKTEREFWLNQGLDEKEAELRSNARIFGSKPGAYGAGLQGLIESQNWQNDRDLANAYINWSCYAYDSNGVGHSLPEVFKKRLEKLEIVLHNQDNREHDLLDSDDYYQFQGGLTVSARALTGRNPKIYFGDNSRPDFPKVRALSEEIARVYRSRVINPKWIAGVMRHGYKGAFEMAATVDYLFAYDATTGQVEDFMYTGTVEAYIFDDRVREFLGDKNPWALRDMAERFLEAHQRGFWQNVEPGTIDRLRDIVHSAERTIEEM